ncbi:YqaJ viral recombinase family protein [Arenibaculum pallidiluteum]|uniref:YqaJ viral recombinase family protein n=1 Tax=Arenibaculum pallidiluteum TaxID=2812559 RepID=UPI001A96AB3F|nr:YqaJ viral recombinase family protein [Arenibaculum pallidiluteum]
MAISAAQRRLRADKIGSSDARRIMDGRWKELWREKTGRAEPPCLDFVPAVQIGVATEPLHARFFTRATGIGCYPADAETYVHPRYDFLVAHLDFLTWRDPVGPFTDAPDTVLEAKFCGGPQLDEELAETYFWQLQHQMMVSGLGRSVLSILRPSGYSWIEVPFDEAQANALLETELAFWWHVEQDEEPGDPLPVEAPPVEAARILDMTFHNEFADHAVTLMANRKGVQAYKEAEAELKALMPPEARIAYVPPAAGEAGLYLLRARDGRVSLRFGGLPRRYAGRSQVWGPDLPAAEAAE